MRCVLHKNVAVVAMRSPRGASAALPDAALGGCVQLLANVAPVLAYEAGGLRDEDLEAAGIDAVAARQVVGAVAAHAPPVECRSSGAPGRRIAPARWSSKPPSTHRRKRS